LERLAIGILRDREGRLELAGSIRGSNVRRVDDVELPGSLHHIERSLMADCPVGVDPVLLRVFRVRELRALP
jgi:hypothetical protein